MDNPRISIITVCKNSAKTIERAISSVKAQTYKNIEHVIIDGASTDGTQEIIRRLANENTVWRSEPDKGISDAFNKGISISTGLFHIILNADDSQYPNCISKLAERITDKVIAISGDADLKTSSGEFVRKFHSNPSMLHQKMSLAHNCTILRTSAFVDIGGYDLNKKIAMDHHLYLRLLQRHGLSCFEVTNSTLTNYYLGGVSDQQAIKGFKEVRQNIAEVTGSKLQAWKAYEILRLKHFITKLIR